MKKWYSILLALLLTVSMLLSFAACNDGKTESSGDDSEGSASSETSDELSMGSEGVDESGDVETVVTPDVPTDRYDVSETPRSGNNKDKALVLATGAFDGKFSPFFSVSEGDSDVVGLTQLPLLSYDSKGVPCAGVDYNSYAYSFEQKVNGDGESTTYSFVLKNGLCFSDGSPVTAEDLAFSVYVLCDSLYSGESEFGTLPIRGLEEYRNQAKSDVLGKYSSIAQKIFEAGVYKNSDGNLAFPAAVGVNPTEQERYWSFIDAAGMAFAQGIADYIYGNYSAFVDEKFGAYDRSALAENEDLKIPFAMAVWGYGELEHSVSEVDGEKVITWSKTFKDFEGNSYELDSACPTAEDFWNLIFSVYGYDFTESGVNVESVDKDFEEYITALYLEDVCSKEGGKVNSISGISFSTVKCDDGVSRDCFEVVIDGVDPLAVVKLNLWVAPKHYYTEGYSGPLDKNGVDVKSAEFMAHLESKNEAPLGAGPYALEGFEGNKAVLVANDSFALGSPKIKNLELLSVEKGEEVSALTEGKVHYACPNLSTALLESIDSGEEGYEALSYSLADKDGYGYIGIQAEAIPEQEVRAALAMSFDRTLVIDEYYGDLARIIDYSMPASCWAYPADSEDQYIYGFDATGVSSKNLFLSAGYIYDGDSNCMYYPEWHEKAGEAVLFKFTLPAPIDEHPMGAVFEASKSLLSEIGVAVEIEVDTNLTERITSAYDAGLQVWAAAWEGGGVDPDMYDLWYADEGAKIVHANGIDYLAGNGSEKEKELIRGLNSLILDGRKTVDYEERKEIYSKALEIANELCVEVPVYQRKTVFVYNEQTILEASLLGEKNVSVYCTPVANIWNVELN